MTHQSLLTVDPGWNDEEYEPERRAAGLGQADVDESQGEEARVVGGYPVGVAGEGCLGDDQDEREYQQGLLRQVCPRQHAERPIHDRDHEEDDEGRDQGIMRYVEIPGRGGHSHQKRGDEAGAHPNLVAAERLLPRDGLPQTSHT